MVKTILATVLLCSFGMLYSEDNLGGNSTEAITASRLAAAEAAAKQGDLAGAMAIVKTVLQYDSGNLEAIALQARLSGLITGTPDPQIGDLDESNVKQQATIAEARMLVIRANGLATNSRFEDALVLLSQAHVALLPYQSDAVAAKQLAEISTLAAHYHDEKIITKEVQASELRNAARMLAEQQTSEQLTINARRFSTRFERVEELEQRAFYEMALSACRRLIADYPDNEKVRALYARLLKKAHSQRNLTIEEKREELLQEVHERLERSLIPHGFDGWTKYPDDWNSRHLLQKQLDAPQELSLAQQQLNEKLASRLSYDLVDQNAVEVLKAFAKQLGVNLVVDASVQAGGDKFITLRANDITFRNTLTWVCSLAQTTWRVEREAIYIGGEGNAEPVLAVYDASEVLFVPKDQPSRPFGLGSIPTTASQNGGGVGAGQALFQAPADDQLSAISPEDFIDIIHQAVSPEIWDNPAYEIDVRGMSLFVSAPPDTHLLIKQFLRSQSKIKNKMVRVDVRFLTINDGYLEEIGVDWRSPQLLTLPNFPGPLPNGTPNTNGVHYQSTQFDYAGSLTNIFPATANTPSPPTAGSGLNVQTMVLNAVQASAILSAVERTNKGTILQAPEIVTLNGVRSHTFMGTQYGFIAAYESTANTGTLGGTFDPTVQVLNLGAVLDVRPLISADGKYVTMEIRPSIVSLASITTEVLTFPRFFSTGVNNGVGGNPNVVTGFVQNLTAPLDLPNIQVRETATTVMIPDGGTLLIGGMGTVVEQQTSAHVPFLGHIPFLGRLFGKRGRYSQRAQLYILARINIINYAELEATL